jgi:hypothetical protein
LHWPKLLSLLASILSKEMLWFVNGAAITSPAGPPNAIAAGEIGQLCKYKVATQIKNVANS